MKEQHSLNFEARDTEPDPGGAQSATSVRGARDEAWRDEYREIIAQSFPRLDEVCRYGVARIPLEEGPERDGAARMYIGRAIGELYDAKHLYFPVYRAAMRDICDPGLHPDTVMIGLINFMAINLVEDDGVEPLEAVRVSALRIGLAGALPEGGAA